MQRGITRPSIFSFEHGAAILCYKLLLTLRGDVTWHCITSLQAAAHTASLPYKLPLTLRSNVAWADLDFNGKYLLIVPYGLLNFTQKIKITVKIETVPRKCEK